MSPETRVAIIGSLVGFVGSFVLFALGYILIDRPQLAVAREDLAEAKADIRQQEKKLEHQAQQLDLQKTEIAQQREELVQRAREVSQRGEELAAKNRELELVRQERDAIQAKIEEVRQNWSEARDQFLLSLTEAISTAPGNERFSPPELAKQIVEQRDQLRRDIEQMKADLGEVSVHLNGDIDNLAQGLQPPPADNAELEDMLKRLNLRWPVKVDLIKVLVEKLIVGLSLRRCYPLPVT